MNCAILSNKITRAMHQLPTRLVAYHGLVEPCVVACMQAWVEAGGLC